MPASEADLTPDWLRAVVGGGIESAQSERIGQEFGLSAVIYRCRLKGQDVPASVIVKLMASDRPADHREISFYSTFGPRLGIRLPRCHYGAIDGNHSVLVLEDLEHATQGDCLDQLDASGSTVMARMVAVFHARWWERPELAAAEWLPPMSERTREWLLSRREKCLDRFADHLSPAARELLDHVEAANARVIERLAGSPETLLHADLHLDNVLFDGGPEHPVILDWARVARGPAAIDLVELLFVMVPGEWERVLGLYLNELGSRGIHPDEASLRSQIGGALLRRFISATCGISRWEPPSERERQLIEVDQRRVFQAIEEWRRLDSDLFLF